MKNDNILSYSLCAISGFLTSVQIEETFKLIQLIITIIASTVALAYTLYKWYKRAKSDGKIDGEEIKEAVEHIKDTANEIGDKIDDYREDK